MIEVSMRQKDQIDRRQIADPATGALDPLEQKKPVREIWINEDIEVAELNEERSMANPSQGDVTFGQLGKHRAAVLAGSARQPRLPDHFIEKRLRIEMIAGRQLFERPGQTLASRP